MEMMDQALLALWAKTDRSDPGSGRYHPRICHIIDVAIVARAIWSEALTPALQRRIASGLGIDETSAEVWVAFFAGLHDLGKASPVFQAKDPLSRVRLRQAGLTWTRLPDDPGHGTMSTIGVERYLRDTCGIDWEISQSLATAVGGHHGTFPTSEQLLQADDPFRLGTSIWENARNELADALARDVKLSRYHPPTRIDHAAARILAGLVSVTDWIESDANYFDYAGDNSSERAYLQHCHGAYSMN